MWGLDKDPRRVCRVCPLTTESICETKALRRRCRACPLRRFAPAPPKWEPLAVRQVSHFILYALLPKKEPLGAALRLHAFAKASHFGRGGIAQAMTERASPAEAAQSLGLDRASDRAALPQGSAFVSQLLTFFSHTYSSTFLQILNVEVFLWNRKSTASP